MCESPRLKEFRKHLEVLGNEHLEELMAQQEPKDSEKFVEVMNLVGDKMRISRMIEAFEAIYPAFPSTWTLREVKEYLQDTSVNYNERIRKALDRKEKESCS